MSRMVVGGGSSTNSDCDELLLLFFWLESITEIRMPTRRKDLFKIGASSVIITCFMIGTWRSLVAHTLGVRGVGGSNPPVPIFPFSVDPYLRRTR